VVDLLELLDEVMKENVLKLIDELQQVEVVEELET
jgi:hypothetical protein